MNIPYPYGLNIHQLQLFEPNKGLIRFSIIIPQLQSNNPFTLIQQRLMSISRPSIINYNYLTPTKITLTLFLSIVYRLTDSSRNCPAADSPVPLLDDTSLLERKGNAARSRSLGWEIALVLHITTFVERCRSYSQAVTRHFYFHDSVARSRCSVSVLSTRFPSYCIHGSQYADKRNASGRRKEASM